MGIAVRTRRPGQKSTHMRQLNRTGGSRAAPPSRQVIDHLAQLWRNRQWQECLSAIETALAAVPRDTIPPRELLVFHVRLLAFCATRSRGSLEAARGATEIYPNDIQLWWFCAIAERRAGHLLKAFTAFNKIRRLANNFDPRLCQQMFELLVDKRRYFQARQLYEYAVRQQWDVDYSYAYRAELAIYDGNIALCRQILQEAPNKFRSAPRYALYASVSSGWRRSVLIPKQ